MAGGSAASLSAVVARLERALAAALGRDVGSAAALGAPLDIEHLTGRLEQLVTFLPNAGHHEQAADAPASKPVMLAPAVVATAAAPAAAAAAPAPVDNSAAEKAAAEKAAAEKAAAEKAAADKAKADAAAAEKAKADAAAAEKAKADAAAAEKAKADAAAAEKAKADAAAKAAADEKAKADAAAVAAAAASKPAPVAAAAAAPGGATVPASSSAASAPVGQFYSYEQLKGTKIDGVNWAEREQRLSDDEFATVFKMTRPEFVRALATDIDLARVHQAATRTSAGCSRWMCAVGGCRWVGAQPDASEGADAVSLRLRCFGVACFCNFRTLLLAGSARRRRRPWACSKQAADASFPKSCLCATAGVVFSPARHGSALSHACQLCPRRRSRTLPFHDSCSLFHACTWLMAKREWKTGRAELLCPSNNHDG